MASREISHRNKAVKKNHSKIFSLHAYLTPLITLNKKLFVSYLA